MTSCSFPHANESVSNARRFVSQTLADLPQTVCEMARLLVSELATNALVHSSGDFVVSAVYSVPSHRVRIDVSDGGGGAPAMGRPRLDEEHGRGLQLVDSLSDRWGVEPRLGHPGKTVWFELTAAPLG